jgi:hydroxyacylglutathione hydrolase
MAKILVHRSTEAHERPKGQVFVSPRSELIEEGSVIDVGKQKIKVIHTPGHSPEHVSLILGENIFVGDTLFLAGCGNTKYGGSIDELYETIAFRLRSLPESFRIFPGHDYSETNLRFALNIESANRAARTKLDEVKSTYSQGREPGPTTIGEEKKYNPFLRFDVPELIEEMKKRKPSLGSDPKAVFKELRELRNNWK